MDEVVATFDRSLRDQRQFGKPVPKSTLNDADPV